MTVVIISIAAFLSTLLGGMFALKFRDKLHLVLGFSAGAVIAVAFFDLLPEALELGGEMYTPATLIGVTALGFFAYLLLDRIIFFRAHTGHEDDTHGAHRGRGNLGAAALSFHSFLDGLAIGLAFQVSTAVGMVVAVAVLVHDFSDGINTVGFITKSGGKKGYAQKWLFIDALAPVAGAASTLLFTLPAGALGVILALFAGFFIYIGASDLIPESHHGHPRFLTTVMTLLGAAVLFVAIRLAGV
jgi:ZIP family zinc transporter